MVNIGDTSALIQYVNGRAPQFGVDPAAALAVATQEGWGGTVGDGGLAYGPWQDHFTEFTGRGPWFGFGRNNQQVQAWAWSNEGIDEALREMAASKGVQGASGYNAVQNIAHYFERPAEPPNGIGWFQEAENAWKRFAGFNNGTDAGTAGSVATDDPTTAAAAQLVSSESASESAPSFLGSTALGKIFARLASPGFWWSVGFFVLAGVLIVAGLLIYFHKQVEQVATRVGKAAAVAA